MLRHHTAVKEAGYDRFWLKRQKDLRIGDRGKLKGLEGTRDRGKKGWSSKREGES